MPKDDSWIFGGDPFDVSEHVVLGEKPAAEAPPEAVLTAGVIKSALNGETALFDVLPGIGKTRSIPTLATETEIPTSVFTNLRDNYNQIKQWGAQIGVPVVKAPTRALCPTLRDDSPQYPANQIAQDARAARDAGWPPSTIHQEFDLPCDHNGHSCPYLEKVDQIYSENPRFIVGHYTQAHNPTYVEDRVVVLDERCYDAYLQQIQNPISKANKYVEGLDEFPFTVARRPGPGERQEQQRALERLAEEGLDPAEHSDNVGAFHAKAPLTAYAIYGAKRMENGLHVVETPDGRRLVFDDLGQTPVRLFDPPEFAKAEAVLALDATPCVSQWEQILGNDVKHYRLFNDRQRNRYLRDEGYQFRQLNTYVWPVSGGNVSLAKCEAYLREIRLEHGQRPDLITSKALLERLKAEGLSGLWREDLHYNALRGKNSIQDSELLVVLGSPGRGDRYYQYQAALHGECAAPATDDNGERLSGHELDYQSDVANDVLESTRRGEVFQAAMRAGRTPDTKATVYIATGMVPEWLSTSVLGKHNSDGSFDSCLKTWTDAEEAVITFLQKQDGVSGNQIANKIGFATSTVRDTLRKLRDEDLIEKQGARRGATWHAKNLSNLNAAGEVDLTPAKPLTTIDETPSEEPYMGSSSITPLLHRGRGTEPFGYPHWMKAVRHRARRRRHAERLDRAY